MCVSVCVCRWDASGIWVQNKDRAGRFVKHTDTDTDTDTHLTVAVGNMVVFPLASQRAEHVRKTR
jgi:hypothetical protein